MLSRSNWKPDRAKESRGEAKRGVVRDSWYADFVFVPMDAWPSRTSAPPSAFLSLAVMF